MPFNASDLISKPFETIFSPYTGILGNIFWVIVIAAIGGALYVKTENITSVGVWLILSGLTFSTINLFSGAMGMGYFFAIIAAIGVAASILSLIIRR